MTNKIAVVGDIHGNSAALTGMLQLLNDWEGALVFSGDYVNRGPDSSGVIQILLDLSTTRPNTFFIAGNHDLAFRSAIRSGSLFRLLTMGGARTVQSYIGSPKGNLGEQLRQRVPAQHIAFLDNLIPWYTNSCLAVAHRPNDPIFTKVRNHYRVYGHIPTNDLRPQISHNSAAIDTGCGSSPDGRLTCFYWPLRIARQVDANGVEIISS